MMAIGVASQGAGAGDDEDGDGVHQRVGEMRLRTEDEPCDEGDDGDGHYGRHEPGRDAVGERWMGARLRWACPTRRTMRASRVSAPTRSARMMRGRCR